MTKKALISALTWRSLDMQRKEFADMPCFVAPDEIPTLLRPTSRKERLYILVMSLAVIADNEKDFDAFWKKLPDDCSVVSQEDETEYCSDLRAEDMRDYWRAARRNGAARIGAAISAKNKRDKSAAGIAKIKDRWPQGSGAWPTAALLAEAGLSLNTVKAVLGARPIAQANYEAAQKRKERRNAKRDN